MWDTPWTMFVKFLKRTWAAMGETELLPHFSVRLAMLTAVLVVTVLYSCSAQASLKSDARAVTALYKASAESNRACSAIVTAPGKLLTAAHCSESFGWEGGVIVTSDGQKHKIDKLVQLGQFNEEGIQIPGTPDITILYSSTVNCPCAVRATRLPALDEPLISAGFPFNLTMIVAEGHYQGRGWWRGNPYLVSTTLSGPGASGGPLFVVQDGQLRLIGVVTASAGPVTLAVSVLRNDLR